MPETETLRPVLDFDTGFPTRLPKHERLAALLAAHGAPLRIVQSGPLFRIEWRPIFPGVPDPVYEIRNPWNDGRRIVGVRLA